MVGCRGRIHFHEGRVSSIGGDGGGGGGGGKEMVMYLFFSTVTGMGTKASS